MSDGRPIEILLVEDNPGDARLAMEALKASKLRNRLIHVMDGEEALDLLHKRGRYPEATTPDLILLDLNLPKKDGRQVLTEIKSDAVLRAIPVVVLTMSSDEADVLRSYDLHANCYVTKPLDFAQFMKVVRTIQDFWLTIVRLPSRPPEH